MTWDGVERRKISTYCQQEILAKLTSLEVELQLMRPVLKRMETVLVGNGRDGLVVEHDRLKQRVGLFSWALGVVYVALVSLLVKRWGG